MDYLNTLFSLQNKTAVIIGGTGELCGAMAEGLAKAGAHAVLVGRSQEKAAARMASIEESGGSTSFIACDVGSKEALQKLADQVASDFGGTDILVNGAGVNSPTPFLDIPEDEMEHILNINFKGLVYACQVFGKAMLERGTGGSIINIGSISAVNPLSRVFTYSASKAAVHNISKNLAREWAPENIRVNTLVPGFFPAEQNKKVLSPDRVASIMGRTPMNRFGNSDELIGATLLLASQAGSFITGTETIVDGGFSATSI